MKNSTKLLFFIVLPTFVGSLQGINLSFDYADQFRNNFVEISGGNNTIWTSDGAGGGFLRRTSSSVSTLMYNSNENAAAGLNRASETYDNPRDLFGGTTPVIFSADVRLNQRNGQNSLGFFLKVPDATGQVTPAGGYAVIFRLFNGTGMGASSDVRFWDYSTSNTAETGGVATLSNTQTFGSGLNLDAWYTVTLSMQDVGSNVVFNASLFETGGNQIGPTRTWTSVSPPSAALGAGQLALRLNTSSGSVMDVDNFSVIPEPATVALAGIVLGAVLWFRRRRL